MNTINACKSQYQCLGEIFLHGCLFLVICLAPSSAFADLSTTDSCVLKNLSKIPENTPVSALLDICHKQTPDVNPSYIHDTPPEASEGYAHDPEDSIVSDRLQNELEAGSNPFAITPHKPNFFLPFTYNGRPNETPFTGREGELDPYEMKFQLSLKFPVAKDLLFKNDRLFFAYTGLSFWQAYNRKFSSPFRETNHEPEMFLLIPRHWHLFGWHNQVIALGFNHQSNGQTGTLSRSWNRIYASFIFERHRLIVSLKPWYRIPEKNKKDINDSAGDDNPDIEDFLGKGELRLLYKKSIYSPPYLIFPARAI